MIYKEIPWPFTQISLIIYDYTFSMCTNKQ